MTRQKLDDEQLRFWIDQFESEMFPHQESEFEQEAFTPEGRKRVGRVIQRLVKTLAWDADRAESAK